jgi:nucleoside-diphosphate-sugar epimerase
MRALVTGPTGFLGGALTRRLLADGNEVTTLGRSPLPADLAGRVRHVTGDLRNHAAARNACAGAEVVFHTAAQVGVWGDPAVFRAVNVDGTRALLEAARAAGAGRFVHTSTPSVVYNGQPIAGADESLPYLTACPSPYPVTKAEAERLVRAADAPGFRTVALRPHLVWGPGDRHLVPRLLQRARAGRLARVGRGANRVDLTFIDNAVDAHVAAAEALARPEPAAAGRAYFITNGEPVDLWDFINALLALHGLPPVTRRIPFPLAWLAGACAEAAWSVGRRSGEPPMTRFVATELAKDHWFSIEAARRDLGWSPRVTMAQGLQRLAAAAT